MHLVVGKCLCGGKRVGAFNSTHRARNSGTKPWVQGRAALAPGKGWQNHRPAPPRQQTPRPHAPDVEPSSLGLGGKTHPATTNHHQPCPPLAHPGTHPAIQHPTPHLHPALIPHLPHPILGCLPGTSPAPAQPHACLDTRVPVDVGYYPLLFFDFAFVTGRRFLPPSAEVTICGDGSGFAWRISIGVVCHLCRPLYPDRPPSSHLVCFRRPSPSVEWVMRFGHAIGTR